MAKRAGCPRSLRLLPTAGQTAVKAPNELNQLWVALINPRM
jgi:hypothetical protein